MHVTENSMSDRVLKYFSFFPIFNFLLSKLESAIIKLEKRLYRIFSFVLLLILNVFAQFVFAQTSSSIPSSEYRQGEIIIKTKSHLSPATTKGIIKKGQGGLFGKLADRGISLKGSFNKLRMHQLKLSSGQDLKKTIQDLEQDPEVEYAEPNYILRKSEIDSDESPTSVIQSLSYDEVISNLQILSNGSYSQTGAQQIDMNDAWVEMNPDSTVIPVVAIMDTGIDYNHNVITQSHALWTNEHEISGNGIDDDNNGYIDDIHGWNFFAGSNKPWDDDGHGTHVAGIVIGASIDIYQNPIETSKIQVMPLKFLGADGSGDTADAVRAIDYAITMGARIINASWGGTSYSRSLHEALSRAYGSGLFIATAAGNAGNNNDSTPIYPSSLSIPGLISVAATNIFDQLASFSNFGTKTVHVAAPGVTIASTFPRNLYGFSSGTSMATPLVAGIGGLILREAPLLTGYQLKEIILETVDTVPNLSQKISSGGRVNVAAAVRAAKNVAQAQGYLPNYTMSAPERGLASESNSNSGSSGGSGGGCGTVSVIKAFGDSSSDDNSPWSGGSSRFLPILMMMMVPVVFWILLRAGKGSVTAEVNAFDMRFAKRIDVSDKILVKTRQGTFEANLKNISKGGLAFAFQGKRVTVDEQVSFIFSSKDGNEQVEVAGRIVWTDDKAVAGVQFHMLNNYVQGFLMRTYTS